LRDVIIKSGFTIEYFDYINYTDRENDVQLFVVQAKKENDTKIH
jgi:hypothetical protein